ncbi:MAG: MaoC family dehydratase N-terminal domain-containing protein [bacterium]|nr:MaoC family dehydratase N-terminal domain-containing protein [bacterium]
MIPELYEQCLPLVGVSTTEHLGRIEPLAAQRFAVAAGALQSDAPHPLLLSSVMGWHAGPDESELYPDGTAHGFVPGVPLEDVRLMGAGQDLEFHEQPRMGSEVTLETTVSDVQLKHGRSGDLLLIHLTRRYTAADGTLLTTCRETFIAR